MTDTKTAVKNGSKQNLNESITQPLLDEDADKTDKETIELKEHGSTGSGNEKDDSKPEKDGDKDQKKKDKKEKKEKKEKIKKEKPRRTTVSYVQTLSVGLNLLDRDDRKLNEDVNLTFEDVIAEPDASHGFDGIWRLAFVIFTGTKHWVYRLISALLAIPLAIIWGVLFSLITIIHIWLITPSLTIIGLILSWIRKLWAKLIGTILEPIITIVSSILSQIRVTQIRQQPAEEPVQHHVV